MSLVTVGGIIIKGGIIVGVIIMGIVMIIMGVINYHYGSCHLPLWVSLSLWVLSLATVSVIIIVGIVISQYGYFH